MITILSTVTTSTIHRSLPQPTISLNLNALLSSAIHPQNQPSQNIHLSGKMAYKVLRDWLCSIFLSTIRRQASPSFVSLAANLLSGVFSQAKRQSSVDLAQHVITGGLGRQVLFFDFFIVVADIFYYRITRLSTTRSHSPHIPGNATSIHH
jgi:hypothetical protein